MRYLLIFIIVTLSLLLAKTFIPHLSKNEKLFKKSTLYKLKDFNLNLDISFLSVVSFITISRKKKSLSIKSFRLSLKVIIESIVKQIKEIFYILLIE